jgi:hypothetical protein
MAERQAAPSFVLTDSVQLSVQDSAVVSQVKRCYRELTEQASGTAIDEMSALIGVLSEAGGLSLDHDVAVWFDVADLAFKPAIAATPSAGSDPEGIGTRALKYYLSTARAQERMRMLAEGWRKDSALIAEELSAVDNQNASAFVGDTRIGYVRAQLAHERAEFLQRLLHPHPDTRYGVAAIVPPGPAAPAVPLDPFLRKYLVGDTVRIPRGKHIIDQVVTVPSGMGLVLEKGARLIMAPGSGLIVNGSLHMRGTGLNPVFIRPTNDGVPWAGIRVNGSERTKCVISGLKMSGGSALPSDDGAAGMLAFEDCEVVISKSTITDASGPAMVSATRGSLTMEECYLGTAKDALMDLAFASGSFTRCSFMGGAYSGIRMKASEMHARECAFVHFGGSALTAGLRSTVNVGRCTFSENRSALVLTDGTQAWINACAFKGNTVALDLHCDKSASNGAHVTTYQNTFDGNGTDKQVDAKSSCKEGAWPGEETGSSPPRAD